MSACGSSAPSRSLLRDSRAVAHLMTPRLAGVAVVVSLALFAGTLTGTAGAVTEAQYGAFSGTVTLEWSRTHTFSWGQTVQSGQLQYTNLNLEQVNHEAAEEHYSAAAAGGGGQRTTYADGSCPWDVSWGVPAGTRFELAFALQERDSGFHLLPALNRVFGTSNQCESANDEPWNGTEGGFESGSSGYTSSPLPDDDPDPRHLAGSAQYTLQSPPMALYPFTTAYSFIVTYDLRRAPANELNIDGQYAFIGARGFVRGGLSADVSGTDPSVVTQVCFDLTWVATAGRSKSSVQLSWNGGPAQGLEETTDPDSNGDPNDDDNMTQIDNLLSKKRYFGQAVSMRYCVVPVRTAEGVRAIYPWNLVVGPSLDGALPKSIALTNVRISLATAEGVIASLSLPNKSSRGKHMRVSWLEKESTSVLL